MTQLDSTRLQTNFYTATYSPDDNKLRLYATSRLDKETYDLVNSAGFKWAPKQELFVAPMWTPGREDLLIKLAGEIGDEDTSLLDRAEQRADRFDDYSEKRASDAERAREAVSAIADNIPFGQPILIGHHSEKRARKDAERIENGMRKAIKMWDQSKYWQDRAAGALQHAKYKELPAVRHRRIKSIQADKRKQERSKAEAQKYLEAWTMCGNEPDADKQLKIARIIANGCWLHMPRKEGDDPTFTQNPTAYEVLRDESERYKFYAPRTVAEVIEHAKKVYPKTIAHCDRWIAHYENRLTYENAMLNEQLGGETEGGMSGRFDIQVGGRVLVGRFNTCWLTVLRVNKSNGVINSVTTQDGKYGIERVKDYQPPTEEQAKKAKKATTLAPLCNYPGEGFIEMTDAEWKSRRKCSDFYYIRPIKATETAGSHRVRFAPGPNWSRVQVFITDTKRVDPPKPQVEPVALMPAPEPDLTSNLERPQSKPAKPERTAFDDMKDILKQGVKVVSANQLFPTPPDVAKQVIELAEIQQYDRVLEPSAGTGALVDQIDQECGITAVEINPDLVKQLENKCAAVCADFLELPSDYFGKFDRIVMNPPFENGSDIKHVLHARGFLREGGRLVSIVANGPRQREKLKPLATKWIDLSVGSFKPSGTNVNTAIVVIDRV